MRINIPPRDLPDNPHVPMLVTSYQHRGGLGVSKQVINTGEGWVYLNKLSTQGRSGCI
jgi:hypothetical protein